MQEELLTEDTIPEAGADINESEAELTDKDGQTEKPRTEEDNEADGIAEAAEKNEANEDAFTIRYKHNDLQLSHEETKRLAQLGKHYEDDLKGIMDDLDYFAALRGSTVKGLVTDMVEGIEQSYREELEENLGEGNPLIEEMLELRRMKNRKTYEDAKAIQAEKEARERNAVQKSMTAQLAEQLEALRELFPEYDTAEKLPEDVIKRAMKSGDLEKELLRFERSERIKIDTAREAEEKNRRQSVGSVKSDVREDNAVSAFMKGVWGNS